MTTEDDDDDADADDSNNDDDNDDDDDDDDDDDSDDSPAAAASSSSAEESDSWITNPSQRRKYQRDLKALASLERTLFLLRSSDPETWATHDRVVVMSSLMDKVVSNPNPTSFP